MEGKESNIPTPFEWLVSRVCEEFHCLPSQAVDELLDNDRIVLDIMGLRAYARAKEAIDSAKRPEDVPDSPMVDQVFAVQAELLKRRREHGRSS